MAMRIRASPSGSCEPAATTTGLASSQNARLHSRMSGPIASSRAPASSIS